MTFLRYMTFLRLQTCYKNLTYILAQHKHVELKNFDTNDRIFVTDNRKTFLVDPRHGVFIISQWNIGTMDQYGSEAPVMQE